MSLNNSVGILMREWAKTHQMRVSKDAINELTERLLDYIETITFQCSLKAKRDDRKTIKEEDMTEVFSYV